ncbi:MAG TPA: hypothetical protein DC054_16680 [Blastocatellia bacterium]|nr:hypothetical protein [Blastocatellia bacterium]
MQGTLEQDLTYNKFRRQRLGGAILVLLAGLIGYVSLLLLMFGVGVIGIIDQVLAPTRQNDPWAFFDRLMIALAIRIFIFVPTAIFAVHFFPRWLLQIRRLGKRFYSAVQAQDILSDETRPIVLYLRSFRESDEAESRFDLTPEEVLARVLKGAGRFVAIGNPQDKSLILGASRFYLKEGVDWKAFVRKLMQRAKLIIIDPSFHTRGLDWEISLALKEGHLEKTLFHFLRELKVSRKAYQGLLRPSARDYQQDPRLQAIEIIKQNCGVACPEFHPKTVFLWFDDKGRPAFVKINFWIEQIFGRDSVSSLRVTIRPLFQPIGVRLSWWRTALDFIVTPTFLLLCFIISLILMHWGIVWPLIIDFCVAGTVLSRRFLRYVRKKLTFAD